MKSKAYAKINLTLDITGVRDDGYHSLRSVMVPISLADELEVEAANDYSIECNVPDICEDNLCIRAAKAFFEACGVKGGAHITLHKNIPFPAGLGGGSSDAAKVLLLLNKLNGDMLSDKKLCSVAADIGSDVPFFIYSKPALCEGRGEILTPLFNVGVLNIVVAIGTGRLKTSSVYKAYDACEKAPTDYSSVMLSALSKGDHQLFIDSVSNAFSDVAVSLCPEIDTVRLLLLHCGAVKSALSGSGPSVFGIFKDEPSALKAADTMRSNGYIAFACKTFE